MSKRYTDTDKWKKQFFKSLNQGQMLFWNFINDDCDHSGAWYVDIEVAGLRIKQNINLPEMIEAFNKDQERVFLFDGGKKLMILPFVIFQYGNEPNPKNRLHLAANKTLEAHGFKWFNGVVTALEQPKGKGMDKVKVKVKDLEEREKPLKTEKEDFDQLESFEEVWKAYPVRGQLKRSASLRTWCEIAVSRDIVSRVQKSITNYSAHLKANDWKTPMEFPKFLTSWDDWENHVEPEKELHGEDRDERLLAKISGK